MRPSSLTRSGLAVALLATGLTSLGCHRSRLFSPLNGRSSLERHANQGPTDIFISGEDATPETLLEEVPQRLATAKTPISRKDSGSTSTSSANTAQPESSQTTAPAPESDDLSLSQLGAATRQVSYVSDSPAMANTGRVSQPNNEPSPKEATSPDTYAGVDVSMIQDALKNHPPEVQREAIRRLMAMSYKKAKPTSQPASIDDILKASLDTLPALPDEVVDRGLTPQRIAAEYHPKVSTDAVSDAIAATESDALASPLEPATNNVAQSAQPISEFNFTDQVLEDVFDEESFNMNDSDSSSSPSEAPASWNFSDKTASTSEPTHSLSDHTSITTDDKDTTNVQQVSATEVPKASGVAPAVNIESLSDTELYDALLKRLGQAEPNESDDQKQRRQIIKRHLMVLSGDPDRAVDKLEGLTTQEQEYLRHQLLGLWTIIDPNGHPVSSRRFSTALPQIRQATEFLAAATDSLDVRALEFCTEIEAYGQVKPFPKRQFDPGQQVILYCEIENFVAKRISDAGKEGFETMLQGSYDLLDDSGRRVASQSLPVDKQVSKNKLRDYFIAYQMYLPESLEPGSYRLRLTMEDVHGKKYGQSEIAFDIKR
ncbi:hypothetical protein [Rhodopirellula baltica]|uniref:Uncharacterized protein n=1 Tax=Rhodopirellula baltica WH47 TaxID=991778 RepID=F2AL97_RHOBT|nr:hypothetical protein [Rhodopirellula baltica]EGF29573.1 conserved hypothetical protein, secreted [Rhodopirellula baltica WH47]